MTISSIKNTFFKNAFTIFSGAFISQAIGVLSPFIITYFYSPSEVGKLTIAISVIALASGIFTLRHDALILITIDDEDAKNLFITSLTLNLFFNVLSFVLLLIIQTFSIELIPNYYLLIPLGVFSISSFTSSRELLIRKSKFKTDAKSNVIKNITILSLQLISAKIRPYASSLLFSKFVGEILTAFLNIKHLLPIKEVFNLNITKKIIPKFWHTTSHLLFSKLLQNFSQHGINYIWAFMLDLKSLGLFHIANKTIQIPSVFIGENLQKVFEQRFLSYYDNELDKRKLSLKVIFFQTIISMVLSLGLYISTSYIFPFVLPDKWLNASSYILLLVPLLIVSIPANSIFSMFKIYNVLSKFNYFEIFENLFKFLAIGYFAYSQNHKMVILSYVWIGVISWILKFMYIYFYSSKRVRNLST